jgi:hypothetical protein
VVTPHFADLIRIRIFVKTKQNSSVLECTSACKSFNHPFQDAVLGFTSTNVDLMLGEELVPGWPYYQLLNLFPRTLGLKSVGVQSDVEW